MTCGLMIANPKLTQNFHSVRKTIRPCNVDSYQIFCFLTVSFIQFVDEVRYSRIRKIEMFSA